MIIPPLGHLLRVRARRILPVVVAPASDPQCAAITTRGRRRCRLARFGDTPYCALHMPNLPGNGPRPA